MQEESGSKTTSCKYGWQYSVMLVMGGNFLKDDDINNDNVFY